MNWDQFFTTQISIDDLGFAVLALFAVWAILTGKLYPKGYVEEIREDRNNWKTAYFESDKTVQLLIRQQDKMIEAGKTTEHVISSLPQVIEEDSR